MIAMILIIDLHQINKQVFRHIFNSDFLKVLLPQLKKLKRRLLIAETRVHFRVSSGKICDGGIPQNFRFQIITPCPKLEA